jgi:hypothetical protein
VPGFFSRTFGHSALNAGLDGVVDLTTRQCAADRLKILENVRAWLLEGASCRLIATLLVESGADLDFSSVWRAEVGLEQAAESIVTVFKPRNTSRRAKSPSCPVILSVSPASTTTSSRSTPPATILARLLAQGRKAGREMRSCRLQSEREERNRLRISHRGGEFLPDRVRSIAGDRRP